MELPQALKPWALYLNLFPLPIRGRLGTIVQRLDRLLGPLENVGDADAGEPEGYEGIDRKGSYDRLLMSEWLLAEEVPEEFLRRASSGEHAFIQLARIKPANNRAVLAIFDAGPSQLGAPRIAQIALIIVLARRAEAAGMRFEWGVLQDPDEKVFSAVSESSLAHFIKRRYAFEASYEQLAYWWDRVGSDSTGSWLIGGARALGHKQSLALPRIQIEPLEELEPERLSVSVLQPGRQPAKTALPLPESAVCVRLLRNLFADKPASPVVTDRLIKSNICFSNATRYLFGRTADDTVILHNIHTPINNASRKPKMYAAADHRIIVSAAFGRNKRASILTSLHRKSPILTVESIGGKFHYSAVDVALPQELEPICAQYRERPLPLHHCAVYQQEGNQRLFTLFGDKLLALPLNGAEKTAEVICHNVLLMTPLGQRLLYATQSEFCVTVCGWQPGTQVQQSDHMPQDSFVIKEVPRKLFIGSGEYSRPALGYIAYEEENGEWVVVAEKRDYRFSVPEGTVVGVVGRRAQMSPGLIVLDQGRRNLKLVGKEWSVGLLAVAAEISSVAVSAEGDIGYASIAGELIVYSVSTNATVYRVTPEG